MLARCRAWGRPGNRMTSSESGAAAEPQAEAHGAVRSAPSRGSGLWALGKAHRLCSHPRSAGSCGVGSCLSWRVRGARIGRGGLHERRGHAATCEPLAAAGGGVWGPRLKEAHGGPRLPGGGAHTQAHTSSSSHPRALAQPACGGHRGDARQQVGEVSRRPRPRAPVHPGKRFQNAQGKPGEGAAHAARGHGARRARGWGWGGGWKGDRSWEAGDWDAELTLFPLGPDLPTGAVNFPAPSQISAPPSWPSPAVRISAWVPPVCGERAGVSPWSAHRQGQHAAPRALRAVGRYSGEEVEARLYS